MGDATSNKVLAISTAIVAFLVVGFFAFVDPIPQDLNYHDFADQRTLFGIPNFFNVASNFGFLIVGVWGLMRSRELERSLSLIFAVYFFGILLTAFGSAWYHLAPANGPLVWDRLPMTIGFAGLVGIIWQSWGGPGRSLLVTLLYGVLGAGSVLYWSWTETGGTGDLRPYAVAAFLPMLVVPVLLVLRPGPWLTPYVWMLMSLYVCAKVFEHFDAVILTALGVSGHSLKHLFAAAGTAAIAVGLRRHGASVSGIAK